MSLIGEAHVGGIRAFAHRGGAAEAPENSLAAFEAAMSLGYVDLETDVRATRDGVCVLHHDARLDRTTDRSGLIRELPWREVRRARVHGREPISRLEELLDLARGADVTAHGTAHVTIDVKEAAAVAPVVDAVRRARAGHRVTVGAFSAARSRPARVMLGSHGVAAPGAVALLRTISWLPTVPPGTPARFRTPTRLFVQVPPRVGRFRLLDERLMRVARERDLEVHAWTIDDPGDMHRLIDLGVHGIMTDRPSLLRDVLAGRGLWPPPTVPSMRTDVR